MSIPGKSIFTDSRASAILYRFLKQQQNRKTVILPVNICPIVPAIIQFAGFPIEYVDIQADNLCPDEEAIFHKISNNSVKYSGVLYNYTYGIETENNILFTKLKNNFDHLWLIEDKCVSLPGMNHAIDSNLTLYSTSYAKQIDLGFGGYGIVNHVNNLMKTKQIFEVQVSNKRYSIEVNHFTKSKDEYFVAIETQKKKVLLHKAALNEIYSKNLPKEIQMDTRFQSWRFNILVENKQTILDQLFVNQLFASSHYSPILDSQKEFPIASQLHSKVVNLFNDLYYTEEQAIKTCKIICDYL